MLMGIPVCICQSRKYACAHEHSAEDRALSRTYILRNAAHFCNRIHPPVFGTPVGQKARMTRLTGIMHAGICRTVKNLILVSQT